MAVISCKESQASLRNPRCLLKSNLLEGRPCLPNGRVPPYWQAYPGWQRLHLTYPSSRCQTGLNDGPRLKPVFAIRPVAPWFVCF